MVVRVMLSVCIGYIIFHMTLLPCIEATIDLHFGKEGRGTHIYGMHQFKRLSKADDGCSFGLETRELDLRRAGPDQMRIDRGAHDSDAGNICLRGNCICAFERCAILIQVGVDDSQFCRNCIHSGLSRQPRISY